MDNNKVNALLFYLDSTTAMDEGIKNQFIDVLEDVRDYLEEEAEIQAKKRKSPNKSGVVCVDPDPGKIVAEYASQKEALIAIGKDPKKSGISDAINGRTSTHMAYGYVWYFKDEMPSK